MYFGNDEIDRVVEIERGKALSDDRTGACRSVEQEGNSPGLWETSRRGTWIGQGALMDEGPRSVAASVFTLIPLIDLV
jgi:hypothetical protein